ncbi:E3 ubiquitin-protein ligase TRIM21-like [Scomber japonicus]|uniref:E3 ubiquitin-protein ligase TRIM21-like n=1 Tax=Scomber japonicus TaxID=13676 RepID=UPI002304F36B|nr:E3 ubiquitin-protein ligase TRIM21-like [Scomber japonicus]
MSAASCLLSEDQFLCSICLDVFTDPVSTPCGHNFCKNCINEHWNSNDQYLCPLCKEVFYTRPKLHINTFISEMVSQFRQEAQQKASSNHKTHNVVPLKEAYEGKKAELGKTEAELQEMIQKRRLKIEEIKHSVDLSKEAADREKAEGVQVFTALKESVERSLNELIETIEEKQRTTEKQAEDFIKELEQEISELKKRSSEVEKLSHSEDHLHLLQNLLSLKAAPPTKDWTEVSVRPSYEGTVVKAVVQLEETLSKQMKKLFEAELKRVQQYAVDVTLDPDTAHPKLILSDDGKQVHHGDVKKNLPDNPERFTRYTNVLGKQSLSSGRFYFEVQVKEKTDWTLGVARESINRKGEITRTPQNGFWIIWLIGNYYFVLGDPPVRLSLKSQPQKVGVFVDYEEGLVSFYDVDAAALIYSFTGCSFTEKLYPYFSPGPNFGGKNSAPLIICPVNQTA